MSAQEPSGGAAIDELLAHDGVEERVVLAGRFGFLAFHGGLEGGTEVVAATAAAEAGSSLYTIVQPPSVRWHIPSHVLGARPPLRLVAFLDHVDVAVAVHGYGRPARPRDLLLGGRNRALAGELVEVLRRRLPGWPIVGHLDDLPPGMRGLHPENPINLVRGGGVQLELPPAVRGASGRWTDDNTGCVPERGLIDALVEVATSYQVPDTL